jgi:hypothetical protein
VLLFGLPGQSEIVAASVLFYTFMGGSITWALAGMLIYLARGLFPQTYGKQLAVSFAAGIPVGAVAVVCMFYLLGAVFRWWLAKALA